MERVHRRALVVEFGFFIEVQAVCLASDGPEQRRNSAAHRGLRLLIMEPLDLNANTVHGANNLPPRATKNQKHLAALHQAIHGLEDLYLCLALLDPVP